MDNHRWMHNSILCTIIIAITILKSNSHIIINIVHTVHLLANLYIIFTMHNICMTQNGHLDGAYNLFKYYNMHRELYDIVQFTNCKNV